MNRPNMNRPNRTGNNPRAVARLLSAGLLTAPAQTALSQNIEVEELPAPISTESELSLFQAEIESCWFSLARPAVSNSSPISIRVFLDQDGNLSKRAEILDSDRHPRPGDEPLNTAETDAFMAVLVCEPFDSVPGPEIVLTFDAVNMRVDAAALMPAAAAAKPGRTVASDPTLPLARTVNDWRVRCTVDAFDDSRTCQVRAVFGASGRLGPVTLVLSIVWTQSLGYSVAVVSSDIFFPVRVTLRVDDLTAVSFTNCQMQGCVALGGGRAVLADMLSGGFLRMRIELSSGERIDTQVPLGAFADVFDRFRAEIPGTADL